MEKNNLKTFHFRFAIHLCSLKNVSMNSKKYLGVVLKMRFPEKSCVFQTRLKALRQLT